MNTAKNLTESVDPAPEVNSVSPYGLIGTKLLERGWSAIPILAGGKRPGHRGVGLLKWQRFCQQRPSRDEIQLWSDPSANNGIGVAFGPASNDLIGIDVDTDDPEIIAAIMSVLPRSTVIKRGAKGFTIFFRGPGIESKSWNVNEKRVLDLLGPGKQSVLPPSVHPDTKQPYVWTGPDALQDVNPADLRELTADIIGRLDEALAPFMTQPESKRAPLEPGTGRDSDNVFRRLNEKALENLPAWVPDLNLYRCRRTAHGYEAVARWRASNTGRPPEKRKLNLKLNPKGIVDFGDGERGYTAIDLTKAALDCDFDTAFEFLDDRLNPSGIIIDLNRKNGAMHGNPVKSTKENTKAQIKYEAYDEAINAAAEGQVVAMIADGAELLYAPVDAADAELGVSGIVAIGREGNVIWPQFPTPPSAREPGEVLDETALDRLTDGFIFDDDSEIEPTDYLVKGILPPREVAFIGGQSGSGKTFIALLLSTSLASGQAFFGHAVKQRVGVAILAAEGAGTYKQRLRVARQRAVGSEQLPICYLGQVPDMADEKEVKALVPRLKAVSQKMMRDYGVRLGAVIIDTLAAAFNLDDENDNSEAARSIRNLRYLAQQVNALMIPVHHYGKGAGTGLRGASGWKAGCDAVISVLAERDEVTGDVRNRELALAKSRDYPEGPISPFTLQFVVLGIDEDGEEFGSCYVEPQLGRASTIATTKKVKREAQSLVQFRLAFVETRKKGGGEILRRQNGGEVCAVRLSDVRSEFSRAYPTDETDSDKRRDAVKKAFRRGLKAAVAAGEFGIEHQNDIEWVWAAAGPGTVIVNLKPKSGGTDSADAVDPSEGGGRDFRGARWRELRGRVPSKPGPAALAS